MAGYLLRNVRVWDADHKQPYAADVRIRGNRIAEIARDLNVLKADGCEEIDGEGKTLMPGMVEGHCHPSFVGIHTNPELGPIPPEMHTMLTAKNVRLLLDHGFTSIFEAASAKPMIGVTIRDCINSGMIAGPRMRASSPEVTVTSGLGDERKRHIHQESFGLIADGPDEMRRVARECVRDGVDNMKINISGDEFVCHARAEITPLTDAELAAFVEVAPAFGKQIACHARSPKSVKMAVRARHRLHLPLRLSPTRRRSTCSRGVQGRVLRRPGLRPRAQLRLRRRDRRDHARGLREAWASTASSSMTCADLSRDPQARHPRGDRRRLRLLGDADGHRTPATSSISSTISAISPHEALTVGYQDRRRN